MNDQVVKMQDSEAIKRLQKKWESQKMRHEEKHQNELKLIKEQTNMSKEEKIMAIKELKAKEEEEQKA